LTKTNSNSVSTPAAAHHRYSFDRFILDIERGALLKDGVDIPLRAKCFGVLTYLVEHHGVLVTRDALLAAVWPGLVVTVDSLTQCVIQIRKALGDTQKDMIRTVPRRGFIFEAPVTLHSPGEISEPATARESWLDNRKPSRWSMAVAVVLALAIAISWWTSHSRLGVDTPDSTQALPNSIAVLPFVTMSDDANEYFADGLAEELLNLLVKIPELQVAARTSSFSFKGQNADVKTIARQLNVAHILEGSVRKAGSQVRITAQLVKASDGFHLWSKTYDRDIDEIFVVQDEIASKVVAALKISLMGAVPEVRKTDPEVYSLYLHGRYFGNLKGKENLEKAISNYKQALVIDPDYAPAWIGLSVAYQEQRKSGLMTEKQAFALSMAATEKALGIDSNMADAWSSLAYMKRQQLDWEGAKAAIDKAMLLEPNNTLVLGTAATLAGNLGQLETSIELFERNVELNPLSLSSLRALGLRYSHAGRYDDAIETFNRVIAINPDFPGIHAIIGITFLLKGDPESALIEVEREPSVFTYLFHRARILTTLGDEAEAQATIDKLLKTTALEFPAYMASTYAWRGENDLAFEWFEIALQKEPGVFAYFLNSPWNKGLESDPRYLPLVEKIGLLEYWKNMQKPGENVPL